MTFRPSGLSATTAVVLSMLLCGADHCQAAFLKLLELHWLLGETPSDTWDTTDAVWFKNSKGFGEPVPWQQDVAAVFSSRDKSVSDFEISVDEPVGVGSLVFDKAAKGSHLRIIGDQRLSISGWTGEINVGTDKFLTLDNGFTSSSNVSKIGKGTLTLAGESSFSGEFRARGGAINLANEKALGDLGNFIVEKKLVLDNTSGADLVVTGSFQYWNNEVVFKGTNDMTLRPNGITFQGKNNNITVESGKLILDAQISFASLHSVTGIRKHGEGTLVIASQYGWIPGRSVVTGGTLQIGDGVEAPFIGKIANKGTIVLAPGIASPISSLSGISGRGNVILEGPGTATLSTANTYSGGTTLNSGTLILYTLVKRPLGSGKLDLNGGTLTASLAGTLSLHSDLNWNSAANISLQFNLNSVSVGRSLSLSGEGPHVFEFTNIDFEEASSFLVMTVKKGFGNISESDFAFTSNDENLSGTFRISGKDLYFDAVRTPLTESFQAAAVPEPSLWCLLFAGAIGLFALKSVRTTRG